MQYSFQATGNDMIDLFERLNRREHESIFRRTYEKGQINSNGTIEAANIQNYHFRDDSHRRGFQFSTIEPANLNSEPQTCFLIFDECTTREQTTSIEIVLKLFKKFGFNVEKIK